MTRLLADNGSYREDEEVAWDTGTRLTQGRSFALPVLKKIGSPYRFALSYRNMDRVESDRSQVISVLVPSRSVPAVNRMDVKLQPDNTIMVTWDYNHQLVDLSGFNI